MSEQMMFPFKIRLYPEEIAGVASWNVFVKHYAKLVDELQRLRNDAEVTESYVEELETFNKIIQSRLKDLGFNDVDRTGPEHYKMVGEA